MSEAVKKHPEVDILVNFASLRSAYDATLEALNFNHVCHSIDAHFVLCEMGNVMFTCGVCFLFQFRSVTIIAEGIPENKTKKLIKKANALGVTIIGPATVSLIYVHVDI